MLIRPLSLLPLSRADRAAAHPASPPADASPAIAIGLATTVEEFGELAPAWNRLHETAQAASVFNSWMWLYEWWRRYGAGRALRIITARQGDTLVGVLPLYLKRTRMLGVPVRLARFVGIGGDTHPDDLGPVLARGGEPGVAAALARAALGLPGADVWALSDIDPRSVFPAALAAAARELGRPVLTGGGERIALVELPDEWSKFMQSLGRDQRWRLRRARRRLAEQHRARFFVFDDAATLDQAVDRLAELHRRRRDAAGEGGGGFRSAAYVAFHRSVIQSFFARRWLRLYCLEVDGEIAAMLYCYRFRNRVYLMQSGFEPSLARLGVGKVLLGHALEHAIGEGNEAFDFLRGEHRYKDELATAHRETACVRVFGFGIGALAYRLRRAWLPLLKARLQGRPARLRI